MRPAQLRQVLIVVAAQRERGRVKPVKRCRERERRTQKLLADERFLVWQYNAIRGGVC